MTTNDKEHIMNELRASMNREELHTRQVAKCLNLMPAYISMALNPKSWDSMSKAAWSRLEEWYLSRDKITSFQIPEGEALYVVKERVYKTTPKATEQPDEHSPQSVLGGKKQQPKTHRQKEGKSVRLVINQAEIADLRQKVKFLEGEMNSSLLLFREYENEKKVWSAFYDELITVKIPELERRIEELSVPSQILVAEEKPRIVIFQRNIYKP
jgi:hypothetical protein